MVGDDGEVAGRLLGYAVHDSSSPYQVVVDGRKISWDDLATALEAYEGCGFRLVIEDRVRDVRSDAEVIELRGPGAEAGSDEA